MTDILGADSAAKIHAVLSAVDEVAPLTMETQHVLACARVAPPSTQVRVTSVELPFNALSPGVGLQIMAMAATHRPVFFDAVCTDAGLTADMVPVLWMHIEEDNLTDEHGEVADVRRTTRALDVDGRMYQFTRTRNSGLVDSIDVCDTISGPRYAQVNTDDAVYAALHMILEGSMRRAAQHRHGTTAQYN